MKTAMYDDLAPWYLFLDPLEDHREEAAATLEAFDRVLGDVEAPTLLELGAGAGNNAFFLKERFACTLTDISEPMLDLSRKQNPTCSHRIADMRTLRLDQTFDAVFVHDAVVYMLTEADLRAAGETAFHHTRPGGAAVFAPDCFTETFAERPEVYEAADGNRVMRCLDWMWDPDPDDTTYTVDYAFLLREGNEMRAVHDRHIEGLFPRKLWIKILTAAGFVVEEIPRPLEDVDDADAYAPVFFLCRRPT